MHRATLLVALALACGGGDPCPAGTVDDGRGGCEDTDAPAAKDCVANSEDFRNAYLDAACETCDGVGGFDCDQVLWPDGFGCELDAAAACACVRGDWSCNTDTPPIVYADPPSDCARAYICDDDSG